MDTIVSDPQPEHECLGFFDAPKEYPPWDRDSFCNLKVFGGNPNPVFGEERGLCRPSLTIHLKCRKRVPHCPYLISIRLSSIYHGPISGAEDIGLGGSITLVLKGRGREQLYGFYSGGRMPRPWGQPKALPRKRNRHGARTQAPFWSNVYYPFTTCHFWFRNCLWLVFQH